MASPLEKDIERLVCEYAKKRHWLFFKFKSQNQRGVPDRIFVLPCGRVIFAEFKRPGKKPTDLQLHVHDKLKRQGCTVWVIDNLTTGKQLIDAATWE